jgi:hypothetical protein
MVGILVAASVGTFGTSIFAGRAPEAPNNLVAIIPYGGLTRELTHNGTERRFPRFQVVSRHQQADVALAKAEQVRAAFAAFRQQQISGVVYEVIIPLSEPIALAHDSVGRFPFATNYEVRWHVP